MMSKITKLTLLAILCAFGTATAQISTPQASPKGSVTSVVGLTDVTIDYFRPKVNDRQIFGEGDAFLQPYGQLWRTGANSGSKLTLSTDAKIAGTDVKAGQYLILSIPGADEWTFILYSEPSIGGNMTAYDEKKAVVNTKVKTIKLDEPVETMTFQIADISTDNKSANIYFAWANAAFKVPIEVSYVDQVMANIAMQTKVNPQVYVQAANFYLNENKDLNQALTWMNMFLAEGDNSKQFWHVHTKARILAALGNKKEAKATAEQSLELAKNSPDGDFGYIKRNQDLIASLK